MHIPLVHHLSFPSLAMLTFFHISKLRFLLKSFQLMFLSWSKGLIIGYCLCCLTPPAARLDLHQPTPISPFTLPSQHNLNTFISLTVAVFFFLAFSATRSLWVSRFLPFPKCLLWLGGDWEVCSGKEEGCQALYREERGQLEMRKSATTSAKCLRGKEGKESACGLW